MRSHSLSSAVSNVAPMRYRPSASFDPRASIASRIPSADSSDSSPATADGCGPPARRISVIEPQNTSGPYKYPGWSKDTDDTRTIDGQDIEVRPLHTLCLTVGGHPTPPPPIRDDCSKKYKVPLLDTPLEEIEPRNDTRPTIHTNGRR